MMYVILSKRIPFETFQVQVLRERVLAQRAARAQRLQGPPTLTVFFHFAIRALKRCRRIK